MDLNTLSLEKKVLRLYVDSVKSAPFYGEILYKLKASPNDKIKTAQTDGRTIEYNPSFMEKFSYTDFAFIMYHELYHALYRHPSRLGTKDPVVWNVACDFVINCELRDYVAEQLSPNIRITVPKTGLFLRKETIEGKTELDIYRVLLPQYNEQMQKHKKRIEESIKNGQGIPDDLQGSFEADIFGEKVSIPLGEIQLDIQAPANSVEAERIESEMKRLMTSAGVSAKMAGNIPDGVERLLKSIKGTQVPWYKYVERYLTAMLDDETDFGSPDKSMLYRNIILPGASYDDRCLEDIVVVFDYSGSISDEEQSEFFFQLQQLMSKFQITGRLLTFDTEVHSDVKIDNSTKIETLKLKGNGGTDFNCVPDYLRKNKIKHSVIICCTDGGLFSPPKKVHDMIWVVTKQGDRGFKPGFGKVLQLSNM